MSGYIDFLESHLGEFERGWRAEGFQVVKFKGGPFEGTVTYSTLGLSNHYFMSRVSNKKIRMD